MSEEDSKVINNIKVTKDCWKKLKIIGLQKDISNIQNVVKEILEKFTNKKLNVLEENI